MYVCTCIIAAPTSRYLHYLGGYVHSKGTACERTPNAAFSVPSLPLNTYLDYLDCLDCLDYLGARAGVWPPTEPAQSNGVFEDVD